MTLLHPNLKLANTYTNRGNFFRILGQAENAIKQLNLAIQLYPQFGLAYVYRALSYTLLNMDAEAQLDVGRVQKHGLDPTLLTEEIDRLKKQRSIAYNLPTKRTPNERWKLKDERGRALSLPIAQANSS